MADITDDQKKFYCVIRSLKMEVLGRISNIVPSPPTDGAYKTLRDKLIEAYSDSEEKPIRQLKTSVELGDSRSIYLLAWYA